MHIHIHFVYINISGGTGLSMGWESLRSSKKGLESDFKFAGGRDPRELPDLDMTLCSLWKDPEGRSRSLLLQFLDWVGNPLCRYVWSREC